MMCRFVGNEAIPLLPSAAAGSIVLPAMSAKSQRNLVAILRSQSESAEWVVDSKHELWD